MLVSGGTRFSGTQTVHSNWCYTVNLISLYVPDPLEIFASSVDIELIPTMGLPFFGLPCPLKVFGYCGGHKVLVVQL